MWWVSCEMRMGGGGGGEKPDVCSDGRTKSMNKLFNNSYLN